jgi:hypothetical protein
MSRALDDTSGATLAPHRNGSASPDDLAGSLLPRRSPGTSGILGKPAEPAEPAEPVERRPAAETRSPADTTAFFSSRSQAANGRPAANQPKHDVPDDTDVIFQRMVSEWLIDPRTLLEPLQSWESVWDGGWAAAEQADQVPVNSHTDHGLPMREPGARLVPGRPNGAHRKPDDDNGVGSAAGEPLHRDPDAVRASLSSHWGGVRAGRSHARDTGPEMDSPRNG